jgi:reticulon-4-interacting protein 1, mitochondrial
MEWVLTVSYKLPLTIINKVHAVGLNPVDAKDVMGDKLPHQWATARQGVQSFVKNKIVGFDFSGTVAEDQNGFRLGDKVFGNMPPLQGTLAEYISVPLDQICHMPSNVSFIQAAALPLVGLTALQSLTPFISPGTADSILILGASGGTGHCAVQVARNLGALHITAVCSGRNAEFVRSRGATHVVDYSLDHGSQDTLYHNLEQSPGFPFHVVLDCVTSADPADRQVDYPSLIRRYHENNSHVQPLLADDYKYLRLGGPSSDWIRAGIERSCGVNCWPDKHEQLFWIRFPNSAHELRQLQEWVEDGKLEIQVSDIVPFTAEAVQGAFDRILERRVQGKIVVEVMRDNT